jgi:hypothetical protein
MEMIRREEGDLLNLRGNLRELLLDIVRVGASVSIRRARRFQFRLESVVLRSVFREFRGECGGVGERSGGVAQFRQCG